MEGGSKPTFQDAKICRKIISPDGRLLVTIGGVVFGELWKPSDSMMYVKGETRSCFAHGRPKATNKGTTTPPRTFISPSFHSTSDISSMATPLSPIPPKRLRTSSMSRAEKPQVVVQLFLKKLRTRYLFVSQIACEQGRGVVSTIRCGRDPGNPASRFLLQLNCFRLTVIRRTNF